MQTKQLSIVEEQATESQALCSALPSTQWENSDKSFLVEDLSSEKKNET